MARNPWFDPTRCHHTPDGFRNPDGSAAGIRFTAEVAREAAHFLGEMMQLAFDGWPFPPGHVLTGDEVQAGWASRGRDDALLWLGHASFLVRLSGCHVLTDPFLTAYASPMPLPATRRLVPAALSPERLPAVDVILVSHNHYDHLDMPALRRLALAWPTARVVVPLGLGESMRSAGFRHVHEHDWWDEVDLPGLQVALVPAIHTSRRGLGDTNRTLWCGFVIRAGERSVFFAGDTAYGEVFREIDDRLGPVSLGLVPIGAYSPRPLMRYVHCTPEEAVQIGMDIRASHLVGMHWGTIRLTVEPMMEPRERFLAAPGGPPRSVMRIGETVPLTDTWLRLT